MEQTQWTIVRRNIRQVTRSHGRLKRARYSDFLIACLYFWAVLHDRPMTWALDRSHYDRMFRPRKLPSISQLNRRIASDRFQRLLQRLHERLASDGSIPIFCVMPLNAHEMPVARQMLAAFPHELLGTLVFADGNYDAHVLHKQVARRGGFLITNPRGNAAAWAGASTSGEDGVMAGPHGLF